MKLANLVVLCVALVAAAFCALMGVVSALDGRMALALLDSAMVAVNLVLAAVNARVVFSR